MSDAVWLINENADNRRVVRPGDFGVNQFESVVNGCAFSDCPHALLHQTRRHPNSLRKITHPKEKVGANPPDDNSALRASRELYVKGRVEANWQKAGFLRGEMQTYCQCLARRP